MSIRSIRQILVVAFGITLSGIALARNPPALVRQQEAATLATRSSAGYRDMNVRFGAIGLRSPQVLRAAGGYRDMNYRFPGGSLSSVQMASTSTPSRWR